MRVTEQEVDRLAEYLRLTMEDFIRDHTKLAADRRGLILTEQVSGACEFLDGITCRVEVVKPQQCQDFPNNWNFPGWQKVCHAKLKH